MCCDTGYVESGKQTDTYIIAYAHTLNGNTEAMLSLSRSLRVYTCLQQCRNMISILIVERAIRSYEQMNERIPIELTYGYTNGTLVRSLADWLTVLLHYCRHFNGKRDRNLNIHILLLHESYDRMEFQRKRNWRMCIAKHFRIGENA